MRVMCRNINIRKGTRRSFKLQRTFTNDLSKPEKKDAANFCLRLRNRKQSDLRALTDVLKKTGVEVVDIPGITNLP